VNDKVVNIPSCQLKPGDKVALVAKLRDVTIVKQGLEETEKRSMRPSFLEYDAASKTGKLLRWPDRGEMSYPVKEQMIVEFYSK
jgi:small subunit ribosomal protein S4